MKEEKQDKRGTTTIRTKIHNLVYNYKTKYEEGFIHSEQKDLLSKFPKINMDSYYNALCCITVMGKGEGKDMEIVIYHRDIEKALLCGLQKIKK